LIFMLYLSILLSKTISGKKKKAFLTHKVWRFISQRVSTSLNNDKVYSI
jgi:hypothetical protein